MVTFATAVLLNLHKNKNSIVQFCELVFMNGELVVVRVKTSNEV
jgi:hypothetical protein